MYFDTELNLLEMASDYFRKNSLEDAYLIGCQHILPSTHRLILELIELGLKKENIALIGKCYSTSQMVMQNMVSEGIRVSTESSFYNGHTAFDDDSRANLKMFYLAEKRRLGLNAQSRLLVLDDGGELLRVVNDDCETSNNILGIEQTSSGYNKLRSAPLRFPIVNVARSRCKLELETPMIADSQLKSIEASVFARSSFRELILILGKGYIGSALQERLKKKFEVVDSVDINLRPVPLRAPQFPLHQYDIIVGATGTTSISNKEHKNLKDKVTLISASTSDREFDAVYLRREIPKHPNCHADLIIGGVTLINSGFPVNFYGSKFDNVPLRDIQLTFALLLAGICQVRPKTNGFHDLDLEFQTALSDAFAGPMLFSKSSASSVRRE